MGSCVSIGGIESSVIGGVGASETIAIAGAGTFALGASTIVAGKGQDVDSKISSQFAHDFIRATVVGATRNRSVRSMTGKDPCQLNGMSRKSWQIDKKLPVSSKQQLRESVEKVFS
jgi:hypothetical protein